MKASSESRLAIYCETYSAMGNSEGELLSQTYELNKSSTNSLSFLLTLKLESR